MSGSPDPLAATNSSQDLTMNQRTIQNACPGFQRPARSRREFLATASNGFGLMALGALLADDRALADGRGPAASASTLKSHHPAKAKHVVFCFMDGRLLER